MDLSIEKLIGKGKSKVEGKILSKFNCLSIFLLTIILVKGVLSASALVENSWKGNVPYPVSRYNFLARAVFRTFCLIF